MKSPDEVLNAVLASTGTDGIPTRLPNVEQINGEPERRRTWRPVDLTAVLDGTHQPPEPTVGARDDGVGLFYSGRVHSVSSESEGGKTWLALLAARHELEAGNSVVYLDFEDDEGGVVGRLLALGTDREQIRDRFAYIRPEDSIESLVNRVDLLDVIQTLRPTLTVFDGITEAMSLHGLELKDNTDIAKFGKMLPRWVADQGPAVVALDHVVKDREGRGRYSIGGVHKLNGINGAAYLLDNRRPFGVGITGTSGVYIAKDRPAQLRKHALPSNGLHWFADLTLTSRDETFIEAELSVPARKDDGGFRPTVLMAKISKTLAVNPKGLSKSAIEAAVGGKHEAVRLALEMLVNEGCVLEQKNGNAKVHTLARPFEEDA